MIATSRSHAVLSYLWCLGQLELHLISSAEVCCASPSAVPGHSYTQTVEQRQKKLFEQFSEHTLASTLSIRYYCHRNYHDKKDSRPAARGTMAIAQCVRVDGNMCERGRVRYRQGRFQMSKATPIRRAAVETSAASPSWEPAQSTNTE